MALEWNGMDFVWGTPLDPMLSNASFLDKELYGVRARERKTKQEEEKKRTEEKKRKEKKEESRSSIPLERRPV